MRALVNKLVWLGLCSQPNRDRDSLCVISRKITTIELIQV